MDNRNYIIAAALSVAVLMFWSLFVIEPQRRDVQELAQQQAQSTPAAEGPRAPSTDLGAPQPSGSLGDVTSAPILTRDAALAANGRVPLENDAVRGSISLEGARIDDLSLKNYRETPDPESANIIVLSPRDAELAYYAVIGFAEGGANVPLPDRDTDWTVESGKTLTPGEDVVLRWSNGQGLTFRRIFSIDDQYLITVRDVVANESGDAVPLYPYAYIQRHGLHPGRANPILHEGFIGIFNETKTERRYEKVRKETLKEGPAGGYKATSAGGWVGLTDKYWLAAAIPEQTRTVTAQYQFQPRAGGDIYQSNYLYAEPVVVPAGGSEEVSTRVFAGVKQYDVLEHYQDDAGIPRFRLAIDWGNLFFLTRPLFLALHYFGDLVGNFGIAILIVTVLIKAAFFPLANKSYEAMSKMKKLQPKMVELRERYEQDKPRLQQEMMELYKREKVNPLAGCLPILVQIPVFFALYKVLYVTIEMRHAPFFGWIQDLSSPDPTTLFNLFGLIPWNPGAVPVIGSLLMIGVWPLIMGVTMVVQMKLNPPPTDPIQEKIFNFMPLIFTIMLASFPAGLVIYWTWNNLLSIIQQYVIMRRMGVDIHLAQNLKLDKVAALVKGKTAAAASFSGGGAAGKGEGKDGSSAPAKPRNDKH